MAVVEVEFCRSAQYIDYYTETWALIKLLMWASDEWRRRKGLRGCRVPVHLSARTYQLFRQTIGWSRPGTDTLAVAETGIQRHGDNDANMCWHE